MTIVELSERRIKDVLFYHQLDPDWTLEWRKIYVGWMFLPHRCELSQEELWGCKAVLWGWIHVLPFLLICWELRLTAYEAQTTNRKIHKNVFYSSLSEVFLNGAWAETCSLKIPIIFPHFSLLRNECLTLFGHLPIHRINWCSACKTRQSSPLCYHPYKLFTYTSLHSSPPPSYFCFVLFCIGAQNKYLLVTWVFLLFKKNCFQVLTVILWLGIWALDFISIARRIHKLSASLNEDWKRIIHTQILVVCLYAVPFSIILYLAFNLFQFWCWCVCSERCSLRMSCQLIIYGTCDSICYESGPEVNWTFMSLFLVWTERGGC